MEDVEQDQSVSYDDSDESVCDSELLSTTSSVSSGQMDDLQFVTKTMPELRRWYRAKYLQCKRLRAKGLKVKFPIKPWRCEQQEKPIVVPVVLSKEAARKIKNRESAERSRQAINDAIREGERQVAMERRTKAFLELEHQFLIGQYSVKMDEPQRDDSFSLSNEVCRFDSIGESIYMDRDDDWSGVWMSDDGFLESSSSSTTMEDIEDPLFDVFFQPDSGLLA